MKRCFPHFVALLGLASMSSTAAPPAPASPAQAVAGVATATHKSAADAPHQISKGGFSFSIEPAPSWVVPAAESPNAVIARTPLHYRVIDDQTRLQGGNRWAYSHVVRVVDEAASLGIASQIQIEFDPSFETLALHHVRILRSGKKIDKLDPSRIELLQRETELEKRMYNGRVTASILLQDVRVGDQIDFDYSLRGLNPVFDGNYVDLLWTGTDKGPTAQYQFRLLADASRKIQYKTGTDMAVSSHVTGAGIRETIFRRNSVPQLRADLGAPSYVFVPDQLQLSEFQDWSQVRRWGQGLFSEPVSQSTGLDDAAADIRRRAADPAGRLLETLKFVQTDVRYFGNELGVNTHKPTAPEKVLAQRFGDCKDKVLLMMALLRRLDIAASPVLVSARFRAHVADMLPSPLAFDHVIVRVALNGTTYWLDGTRDHQTGNLANRQALGLGKGLLLADETAGPIELQSAFDEVRANVEDIVRVDQFTQDPTLESRITYRGDLAEILRAAMATRPLHDIETQIDQQYSRFFPTLQSAAPLEVHEIPDEDAFTIVQKFTIPGFWHFNDKTQLTAQMAFWALVDPLRYPASASRLQPFAIVLPGIYEHRITVELPTDTLPEGLPQQNSEDSDSIFSIHISSEITPSRIDDRATLHIFADEVAPDEWAAHVAKLAQLDQHLAFALVVPSIPKRQFEPMRKQLTAIDEDVKLKKLKFNTKVQLESQVRTVMMTYAIDGGRLSPAMLPQALAMRGVAYDNLGQFSKAQADTDQALKLAPASKEALAAASVNAMARRDYPRAIELANQSLAADPKNSEALFNRAKAYFFSHDYFPAYHDLNELLKDRAWIRRGYPVLLLYLTTLHMGSVGSEALSSFSSADLPSEWPRPLIDVATGKINVDEAMQKAKASAPANQHLCEAFFYLAEKSYAYGDDTRAAVFFESSVNQGVTESFEDWGSRNELVSIDQKRRKASSK
jgi:lipoprotein NlpI